MFFRFLSILKIFIPLVLVMVEICCAQISALTEKLIVQLGCPYCHSSLQLKPDFQNKIPNLSYAGLRYNPAYLFDFLQNPEKIRRHIGISTMPNFHFSRPEALGLVLFLETQNQIDDLWPDYPSGLKKATSDLSGLESPIPPVIPVVEDSVCLTCHSLNGKEGVFAVDLATISYRLKADWVKKYLVSPLRFGIPVTTMPEVFYTLSGNRSSFIKILPNADQQINQIIDHLFYLNKDKKAQLDSNFNQAKTDYPNITIKLGEKIFRSQNCSACHSHNFVTTPAENFAPDLNLESLRVDEDWLSDFLKKPYPIRPFGFLPGSGSRMPDFRLSESMVRDLTSFFMNLNPQTEIKLTAYFPGNLTAFSKQKAGYLLKEKLSCLGCHRLGSQGGKIGPDLSGIGKRLKPFYFYSQINNPSISRHAIMPKIQLPDKTLRLIADFLYSQNELRTDFSFLSLTETELVFRDHQNTREDNYLKYCSMCHGTSGGGDGYNAKFLPVKPIVHADSAYMAGRPDDTLFDGIYAGGYILNKSQFMPPFGFTISNDQIEQLVAYMRQLCNCNGPDWSLDNK